VAILTATIIIISQVPIEEHHQTRELPSKKCMIRKNIYYIAMSCSHFSIIQWFVFPSVEYCEVIFKIVLLSLDMEIAYFT
jgi:hypothetical protein